jgi:hypothetical protein
MGQEYCILRVLGKLKRGWFDLHGSIICDIERLGKQYFIEIIVTEL